jgi:hypothetical protein
MIIPTVFRDDYLGALRRLTRRGDPSILIKALRFAHDYTAAIDFSSCLGRDRTTRRHQRLRRPRRRSTPPPASGRPKHHDPPNAPAWNRTEIRIGRLASGHAQTRSCPPRAGKVATSAPSADPAPSRLLPAVTSDLLPASQVGGVAAEQRRARRARGRSFHALAEARSAGPASQKQKWLSVHGPVAADRVGGRLRLPPKHRATCASQIRAWFRVRFSECAS